MRLSSFLGIGAFIALIVGAGFLGVSDAPIREQGQYAIPAGPQSYLYFDIPLYGSGYIYGMFSSKHGDLIQVYVFTNHQYTNFREGGGANPESLWSLESTSGGITVDLPVSDTYHVVFAHGSGYDTMDQAIAVSLEVSGHWPVPLAFGIGATAAVIGLFALAIVRRLRENRHARTIVPPPVDIAPSRPPEVLSDVVSFEGPGPFESKAERPPPGPRG